MYRGKAGSCFSSFFSPLVPLFSFLFLGLSSFSTYRMIALAWHGTARHGSYEGTRTCMARWHGTHKHGAFKDGRHGIWRNSRMGCTQDYVHRMFRIVQNARIDVTGCTGSIGMDGMIRESTLYRREESKTNYGYLDAKVHRYSDACSANGRERRNVGLRDTIQRSERLNYMC